MDVDEGGKGRSRILILDDEIRVVKAVSRVFAVSREIKVESSTSPDEALRLVEKTPDLRLVISDYLMPGMDGLEFLTRVSQLRPEIIRIVLTGHANLETTLRAINEVGVYKFILKPWNNHDLYWTVVRALELEEVRRENRTLKERLKLQAKLVKQIEDLYPGISRIERDRDGAIVLDEV
ncbi:MAG: response regulator [Deltaproteobacteria bacterium]|nr:response regulator [Deltaproteobacteria bacterium]